MKEPNPLSDQSQTPEDVATLYSWANLHGAKYRDFSASRAQTRETARLRAEQALEEELHRNQNQAEAEAASEAEARRAQEEAQAVELAYQAQLAAEQATLQAERDAQQAAAELAAQRAAQQAAELAARMATEQAARLAEQEAVELAAKQAEHVAQQAEQAVKLAAEQATQQAARQRAWQQPRTDHYPVLPESEPAAPYYPRQPEDFDYPGQSRPQPFRPAPPPPQFSPAREENSVPRNPFAVPDSREPVSRPAWLTTDNPETPNPSLPASPLPPAPDDTLQGSRDRLTSRWFALRGVFDGNTALPEAVPAPAVSRAPAMAIFSLAGGVGKTSIVATLGRALSARGERVLLVDTAAFGLLPFFFGATDQRPGVLRTFNPPAMSSDAPIQMVTIDPDGASTDPSSQESLSGEISKFARGVSRVIVDLATASGATTRRIMRISPLVMVPVVPDMNSVVSVSSIDAFFEHNSNPGGKSSLPYYILNQFDPSLPLHLDVREVLREQLSDRLLPFALRRAPAMSEALAEGMTVMDYAPGSTLAEDFVTLAGWVKALSAPATTTYRGVRWSER